MISEWFVQLYTAFTGWVATLFGEWEPPDVLADPDSPVRAILQGMSGVGVWVDWGVLGACVAVSVGVWAAVVGMKTLRAILAHIPQFGGAGD